MSVNTKRILIETESHEVFIIRPGQVQAVRGYCPVCGDEVEMMNFDMAISHSGIGGRELAHRSDVGDVHSIEAATGHLLICTRSLTDGYELKKEEQ